MNQRLSLKKNKPIEKILLSWFFHLYGSCLWQAHNLMIFSSLKSWEKGWTDAEFDWSISGLLPQLFLWQKRDWQLINFFFQHLLISLQDFEENLKKLKTDEIPWIVILLRTLCHYKRLKNSPLNNIFPMNEPALVQEQKHHQRATCSMICELFQSCLPKSHHSKINSTLFCHWK